MFIKFTPKQQKLIEILSDGMRHTTEDIRDRLNESCPNGASNNDSNYVEVHISHTRKKLRGFGRDIIREHYQRKFYYRYVILIGGSD